MWALLRLPRFGGANHADGHDNRPRHRKVGFQIHGIDAAGNVIVRALSSATFCHSPSYRRCNKKLWIDRRCEQPSLTTLIHSQRAWRSERKLLTAALGHAVDFFAWRSLRRQQLSNEAVVDMMIG